MELFWAMISPSLTNESIEMGIFKFFNHFSKIEKIGKRYKVERIGKRANICPTLISTLKKDI